MKRITLLLAISALALSACGGSNAKAASSTSENSSTNSDFAAYQSCMKDNGVTLPDRQNPPGGENGQGMGTPPDGAAPPDGAMPPPDGAGPGAGGGFGGQMQLPDGVSQEQYDKALAACADKRPQRQAGQGEANGSAGGMRNQAYLSCLKDNGVDVDPAAGGQALANVDRNSDTFKTANTKCASLIPQRPAGSTTTTTVAA